MALGASGFYLYLNPRVTVNRLVLPSSVWG